MMIKLSYTQPPTPSNLTQQEAENLHFVAELGVLFLLFEMGLELDSTRLKSLFKYAFGLGFIQVVATTAIFALSLFPFGGQANLLTEVLEQFPNTDYSLVNIRDLDEAVVVGAALSLSSSAFVLQIMSERGELPTRFGSATLGVLLFQDIAVVPLLVLLPLIEKTGGLEGVSGQGMSLISQVGPAAAKALGLLGAGVVVGKVAMRRLFDFVAESRSSEAFVATILLAICGTSLATSSLGFSDSLGAFTAGLLLAETNYRTQIEADLRPVKGLLLGLFFVATGSSIDSAVLINDFPTVVYLLVGLLLVKTTVTAAAAPFFGLSRSETIRTSAMLSQGGEFAFVLISLAQSLNVIPSYLSRLLIIVVVASMVLTPALADGSKALADFLDSLDDAKKDKGGEEREMVAAAAGHGHEADRPWGTEPIVICGLGSSGQVVSNMLQSPMATIEDRNNSGGASTSSSIVPYVMFDLNLKRVIKARKLGLPVVYGDGAKLEVLKAAGIETPKAVVVAHTSSRRALACVTVLRRAFPHTPIYARANDILHAGQLVEAGANKVSILGVESGLVLGCESRETKVLKLSRIYI